MRVRCWLFISVSIVLGTARVVAAPTARENYKTHCTSCHGPDGKSQTRLGKKSGAKDLSDKMALAKLTDEQVFKTIKEGRKNDKGEEKMEPFGDGSEMASALVSELKALDGGGH